jgi:hypothetical protein
MSTSVMGKAKAKFIMPMEKNQWCANGGKNGTAVSMAARDRMRSTKCGSTMELANSVKMQNTRMARSSLSKPLVATPKA